MNLIEQRLAWIETGAERVLSHVDGLPDAEFAAASTLPGWTVAHLVAHIGYNAKALSRLLRWARTGVVTPMYADGGIRNAEIGHGAALPPAELRELVRGFDTRLRAELAEFPGDGWETFVVTAQGQAVPVAEVPWLRTRELWIHGADLGIGAGFDDFPPELLDALLTDLTAARRGKAPGLLLCPVDRTRTWQVPGVRPATVDGSAADLCRWLTGRGAGALTDPPDLGKWL
ncbi:maleylpyruvate isomerase family mycothiol-dependent enzyme [Amycolatopsis sp. NPDC059021]|uniref:maleylpyruvate isomerase family mycothiol-dependent enzyme n=1 Tax=Amycolatopsis sp. NPDC059021 TaxID=3346704 RepID=UPI00366AA3D3